MYTQCPDCSTAFRVTATVLKQAAGKVRCGGCGNAFNALEYLSETMPDQPASNDVEENLPELKPEPLQNDDALPASISAEQSAALLKTLDELAGSDIRIEDTGVEWRVLDDDELGDSPVDEILEDSPTPVDEFLTQTPAQVDAPEIFEEEANAPAQTPVDELRFDDNTPLPDDFDFGEEAPHTVPLVEEPEADDVVEEVAATPQPDFDLSAPDEWTDILDEVDDLGAAPALPLDEELAALDDELADEMPAEPETEPQPEPEIEEPDDEPTIADELEAIDADADDLLDMDTQFALQAEAMGIDLSGIHDTADEEPVAEEEPSIDELLAASDDEDREIDELLDEELVDEVDLDELALEQEAIDERVDEDAEETDVDDPAEQLDLIGEAVAEDDGPVDDAPIDQEPVDEEPVDEEPVDEEPVDEQPVDEEPVDEEPVDEEPVDEEPVDEQPDDEELLDDEPDIPPMTEEEQTINMQIDADLMAFAVEDKDGLASTIIIPDGNAEEALLAEKAGSDDESDDEFDADDDESEQALKDTSAGFETIIMEGEEIRSGLEREYDNEEDKAAAAALVGAAAAEREAERKAASGGRRWGLIVGIVLLTLVLALQAVHQQRDVLAKIPAFNDVAGPLYRMIGQPLAPEWDITGWRFEATKGRTDEDEQNLTIYSRLGNRSDESLPYPIIVVSLVDRFQEPMGSVTLDPGDYLPDSLDPRKLVSPGNSFEASITVKSPPPDAPSYRLHACYRAPDGDLRCKDQGFK